MHKLILIALIALQVPILAQTGIPGIPIPENLLQHLDEESVIVLTSQEFHIEDAAQTLALEKASGCSVIIRFIRRNVVGQASE